MAHVRLDQIRLPADLVVPLKELKPLPALDVPADIADLISMLRPPVLSKDAGDEEGYLVLANARVIQWRKHLAIAAPDPKATVPSLIVEAIPVEAEVLAHIEEHLAPFVLGLLSEREERVARKELKDAGISSPRPRSQREQLKSLRRR